MKKIIILIIVTFFFLITMNAQELFIKRPVDLNFQGACSIEGANINNDGYEDILGTASGSDQVAWWENDGSSPPQFTFHLIDDSFSGAIYGSSADLNGDSLNDVLGAAWYGGEISIWINNGGNPISWTKFIISNVAGGARSVIPADIDNDGDLDLVVAAFTTNEVILFNNEGGNPVQWTAEVIDNNFTGAHWVDAHDMDGDGDQDILSAAYMAGDIAIWYN